MSRAIVHAAPSSSIGINTYACNLARALRARGCPIDVRDADPKDGRYSHFHLGNSTRSLYIDIARAERPSIVTLHDVVPRTGWIRPFLVPLQRRLCSSHVVIVHSDFSEGLLRRSGFDGQTRVIRHGCDVIPPPAGAVEAVRSKLSPDGRPILMSAGILRAPRGIPAIAKAAKELPEFVFAFVGRVADDETAAALADSADNVVVVGRDHDIDVREEWLSHLAAADLLLNFRTTSVGEASGPVAEAHALGVPVVGYGLGALPEYCGEQDTLFPVGTSVEDALRSFSGQRTFDRIPAESPVNTTWDRAARETIAVYDEIGWSCGEA